MAKCAGGDKGSHRASCSRAVKCTRDSSNPPLVTSTPAKPFGGPAALLGMGKRKRAGPPNISTSNKLVGGASDQWQTDFTAWKAIAHLFKKYRTKQVWQPFFYDGQCAHHLAQLGFQAVTHQKEDFFQRVRDKNFMKSIDLIWDNPPYTNPETKETVLRTLAQTGKPFAMLLPISVLHVGFVREILDMSLVQVILPRRVHVRKTGGELIPFKYLCWLCYRMCLPRDLYFLDD